MNKIIIQIVIFIIKIYKYTISPLLGNNCRYLPCCSDYFIESLRIHSFWRGMTYGFKRIIRCHPFKIFGGSSGLDFVPKKKEIKNG